jgi:hypothetical protein
MLRMHRGRYIAFVLNAMFWRVVRNLRAVPLPQLLYCLQQKVSDFLPVKFISRLAIFRIYVSPLFCHILIHSYLPLSHYLTVPLPHWPIAPPLNASLSPLPHCPHRQIFFYCPPASLSAVSLPHCPAVTFPHCPTASLTTPTLPQPHCYPSALSYCLTIAGSSRSYCITVPLTTVSLPHSSIVTLHCTDSYLIVIFDEVICQKRLSVHRQSPTI